MAAAARHARLRGGERFWGSLRLGPAAIEPIREADLESAWQIGRAFANHEFSRRDRAFELIR